MKRLGWLGFAAVALLLLVMTLIPTQPDRHAAFGASATTYSAGPRGARALFLLLQDVGLTASPLRRPLYAQQPGGAVLWILGAQPLGRSDRQALVTFVQGGGALVVAAHRAGDLLAAAGMGTPEAQERAAASVQATDAWHLDLTDAPMALLGAPEPMWTMVETQAHEPVVAAWKVGTGTLVTLGVDDVTENQRIGRGDNGVFLARLAMRLGNVHVFDEVKTGFGDADMVSLLTRVPYRWGIAQAALALAVGVLALAARRTPVQPPPRLVRRRTLDQVEAVAQLWQQARDAGLPLRAILAATQERARVRLGGGTHDKAFIAWIKRVRPELLERAQACWQRAETLAHAAHPDVDAARAAVLEAAAVRRKGNPMVEASIQKVMQSIEQAVVGRRHELETILAAYLADGHVFDRRSTRHRQNAAGARASGCHTLLVPAYPIHARPDAGGCDRSECLRRQSVGLSSGAWAGVC